MWLLVCVVSGLIEVLLGRRGLAAPCFLVWLLVCVYSRLAEGFLGELLVSLLSPFWCGKRLAGEERACYIVVSCDS